MSVSSSSWGLGRDAVCDCGTPWTFLLPFLLRTIRHLMSLFTLTRALFVIDKETFDVPIHLLRVLFGTLLLTLAMFVTGKETFDVPIHLLRVLFVTDIKIFDMANHLNTCVVCYKQKDI